MPPILELSLCASFEYKFEFVAQSMCCQRTCVICTLVWITACLSFHSVAMSRWANNYMKHIHARERARAIAIHLHLVCDFFYSIYVMILGVSICLCHMYNRITVCRWKFTSYISCIYRNRLNGTIHLISRKMTSDVLVTRMNAYTNIWAWA